VQLSENQAGLWSDQYLCSLSLTSWSPESWPLAEGWADIVQKWLVSPAGNGVAAFISTRLADAACIYPCLPCRALAETPLNQVKVVILGQDPYHGRGQAEGLSFSVASGVKLPPSLRNIFKELLRDGHIPSMPVDGSLLSWAKKGVLLLNTCLTVEDGRPASHAKKGWEALTDAVIAHVAQNVPASVFMLWGAHAQAKVPLIELAASQAGTECLILQSNHPSPLSALRPPCPFIGNAHFSLARRWLGERGIQMNWAL
jgi:uracil-DNA glycosylase